MIAGRATAEGTARFAGRSGAFRPALGLQLSPLGLGTYLGPDDDATDALYREAIDAALVRRVNVVDTAINYRSQRSERAIGAVLAARIASGALRRDEVLVSTKGGFLAFDGSRPRDPRRWIEETFIASGLARAEDIVAGCHCMSPRYLEHQVEKSRANLGLETIDVYHLHNPETQAQELRRPDFLARIRAAFETLERLANAGKIGVYGTATWDGYRAEPGTSGWLSLEELIGIAQDIAGAKHHFRAVQLPVNLAMPEAWTRANQPLAGRRVPLLAAAREAGLYVQTSASILQGRLARNLPAALRAAMPALATDAQRALQLVRSLPGVTTALTGMKLLAHVEENVAVASVPPLDEPVVRALLPPEA